MPSTPSSTATVVLPSTLLSTTMVVPFTPSSTANVVLPSTPSSILPWWYFLPLRRASQPQRLILLPWLWAFLCPNYHCPDYNCSDYHCPDYHCSDYHYHDYHYSDYHCSDYNCSDYHVCWSSFWCRSTNVRKPYIECEYVIPYIHMPLLLVKFRGSKIHGRPKEILCSCHFLFLWTRKQIYVYYRKVHPLSIPSIFSPLVHLVIPFRWLFPKRYVDIQNEITVSFNSSTFFESEHKSL
jgi:hypothetical protein